MLPATVPLAGALPGIRIIQDDEVVERSSSHEAVSHVISVNVEACKHSEQVDAESDRALAGGCARARSIKCSEGTGRSAARDALEAMEHVARVNVGSRDRPLLVDAKAPGTLAGACARTRSFEGSDGLSAC